MFRITRGGTQARHPVPFKMERPVGNAGYLLLYIKTEAKFNIAGKVFNVMPETLLIVPPHIPYSYVSVGKIYIDDWMHFECSEGEMEDFPKESLCKPIYVPNSGQLLVYIRQVIWEFMYASEASRAENEDLLMRVLFNHIKEALLTASGSRKVSPYEGKLREIRMELASNPGENISVESCAKSLQVSVSYFQHLYTEIFNVSFKEDLINMRLRLARELLTESSLSIEEVAYQAGYNNPVHFFRQFKAHEGCTPLAYRKSH